jgi:hypothetical protein
MMIINVESFQVRLRRIVCKKRGRLLIPKEKGLSAITTNNIEKRTPVIS